MSAQSKIGRGAPGRPRVPREERQRQMVEVAERVFERRGYRAASMDEIAAECGVTKPMLYAYFGSKEGLFAACGVPAGERFRAQLRDLAGDDAGDPADRLWRALKAIFTRIGENRETWMLLYPPDGPAPTGAMGARAAMNRAAMTELVADLLRGATGDSELAPELRAQVDALAHAVVGATLGMAGWFLKHPGEHPDLPALRVMNLIWRGLEALERGDLWLPGR